MSAPLKVPRIRPGRPGRWPAVGARGSDPLAGRAWQAGEDGATADHSDPPLSEPPDRRAVLRDSALPSPVAQGRVAVLGDRSDQLILDGVPGPPGLNPKVTLACVRCERSLRTDIHDH